MHLWNECDIKIFLELKYWHPTVNSVNATDGFGQYFNSEEIVAVAQYFPEECILFSSSGFAASFSRNAS